MSVTALHVPFKKEFEPIVRILENVAIASDLDESKWKYYRVKYIEPFFKKITTDVIPNGGNKQLDLSDAIGLNDNVLGQIRITELTDGFEIEVWQPATSKKYTTKKGPTRIDSYIVQNYPNLTEMFYLGDGTPTFVVYNNSGADGSATIRIIGLKYYLEPLKERPREFTVIYIGTPPPPQG